MSDTKTHDEAPYGELDGTEELYVVSADGETEGKTTTQDIADLGGGGTLTASVPVSSAEILALFDTPKQLIAAPGAGKYISIINYSIALIFGTAPYVVSDGIKLIFSGETANIIETTPTILDAVESSVTIANPALGLIWTNDQLEDKAVQLYASSTNPTTTGVIATTSLGDGGSGYDIGDTGTIASGNGDATYIINTVGVGGAVLTFSIVNPGTSYTVGDGQPTSVTTGDGDGLFTIDIDTLAYSDGTLVINLLYRIIDLPA